MLHARHEHRVGPHAPSAGPGLRADRPIGGDRLYLSIITAAELRYGCARKGSSRLLAQAEAILGLIDIVSLDVPADAEYGGIRAGLEAAGKTIGPKDLLIAAHAYALDCTLVTPNVEELRRVRGLKLENWLA